MILAAIPFINDGFFNWTLIGALLVNGLKNGAIYALMALAVVIIYKTTGQLNFAQGEMGTVGAFIVFVLAIEQGWSYWLAIPAALVFSFLMGAVLERTLVRPIERRSALGVVIVTLGIFLVLNALVAAIWGTTSVTPLAPVPGAPDDQWVLAEGPPRLAIRYSTLAIWVTLAAVVAVLLFFFQKTKLGLGYRAVAANRESSQLVGVPVGRMLMLGWAISAVLGTIAAIMVSQSTNTLDFNLMSVVLLYGFASAALGGFDSIPGAVVGGLIVGMAEAFIPSFFSFVGSELSLAVALAVIVIVLLVRPEGLFGSKRVEARMTPKVIVKGSVPHRLYQVVGYAILLALILWVATSFENFEILNYARVAADSVAILGLMIIIGYSGQVSIGQSFFFGLGAYVTAWLGVDKGWPFLLTLPVSAALGLLVGFVIGIPALRIRGLYLALVTLALAAVFPVMAKLPVLEDITGGANGKPADVIVWQKPDWMPLDTSDQGWQFLVLCAIATVMFVIASNMMKSRPGRSLVALRDSEVGAAVSGVWPARWKTGAFAMSAAYGAIGGSMLVFVTRIAAPETGGFTTAIALLTGAVLGGLGTISGAVIGALAVVFVPYYSSEFMAGRAVFFIPSSDGPRSFLFFEGSDGPLLANALYGVLLIAVVFVMPGGIAYFVRLVRSKFVRFVPKLPQVSPPSGGQSAPEPLAAGASQHSQGGEPT